ncbi:lysophospholipid acyltransferase family protein [Hyphomonas pacifica]|uniref:Uncharacterized protein n=1 Tax=Hyphomonas pacifica TaxID=1280941 RepID=A0A062U980_9PROT|nr:lysophospholipid acyltransferase family protein [Hyphomonas pacifica]KCZ52675.1 hypothetical protein HY2_08005 [Hyphomonas pacifica]RAN34039.1 hypothetical protein HY3_11470 [Hyphomonas pacifica]
MKSLFRSKPVTTLLGALIWAWMVLVARTVRWKVEGIEQARQTWSENQGVVVASWHSRIMMLPSGWIRHMKHWPGPIRQGAMLISLSPDGEAVTRAIAHLGIHAIRGSTANKKKAQKDKGGIKAVAEAVRLLRSGAGVCITPDGPRGPAEIVSLGAIMIAQRAGAPILPYALSVKPAKRLGTWDRFIIPFPFARGAIVYGEPLATTRDADPRELQADLQKRLDAATQRADMLAGYSTDKTPVTSA